MAGISWPATLYGFILKEGFQEIPPENTVRTKMDVGPEKVRRRGTAAVRKFSVQMFFTTALVATFETFYVTTSKHGSLEFSFYSPRVNRQGEAPSSSDHRFASVPTYVKRDQGYIVSFQLEEMP